MRTKYIGKRGEREDWEVERTSEMGGEEERDGVKRQAK